ncbi:MAG TPA: Gfo/Idh/MocA family oxidoreductase, partial [Planctomycetaceae bacterium]|nr:Gfo/Idh/MocA family oxidoreductase [Planctomycetaceae bacterium]
LAVGLRDEVALLDAASREVKQRLTGKFGQVDGLAFSPDGQRLAIGGYQTLQLWDAVSGKVVRELSGHRGVVTGVAFSPDGQRLVSTSDDESARIWTVADGASIPLAGHQFPVHGVAWSADGQRIVTAAGDEFRPTKAGEVILRDAGGTALKTLTDHKRAALSAAFSPDGRWLVSGGLDERALVYDLRDDKLLGFFGGHQRPVNALVFHPTGKAVLSVGGGRAMGGNTFRVWRPEDGAEYAVGEVHEGKVVSVAVSPDGKLAATGGQDQMVYLWDVAFLQPSVVAATTTVAAAEPKVIRIGVIGLDTSHAPAFAKLLNDPEAKEDLAGCKVVAAYPKGSPDIPSSTERVPGYTEEFKKLGIEIVDSIPALLEKVDCVLLETNDGRPHLEQVRPVLAAGKRCFIDKPIAGSLSDAIAIFELSKKTGTPLFSSSSLRFVPGALAVRGGNIGKVLGCDAFSPCSLEATHPDLFWYGIHGVEMLFTAMGTGCESVTRAHSEGLDVVVGTWDGGRIGTFRGIRAGKGGYGGRAFGETGQEDLGTYSGYRPLVVEIVKFFKTGEVPVTEAETLEIYAFMEAADESKRQGGVPVTLKTVMDRARQK